jgi:hypothetical protein
MYFVLPTGPHYYYICQTKNTPSLDLSIIFNNSESVTYLNRIPDLQNKIGNKVLPLSTGKLWGRKYTVIWRVGRKATTKLTAAGAGMYAGVFEQV